MISGVAMPGLLEREKHWTCIYPVVTPMLYILPTFPKMAILCHMRLHPFCCVDDMAQLALLKTCPFYFLSVCNKIMYPLADNFLLSKPTVFEK